MHGFTLYTLYYIYYCKILTILWKEVDVVKPKICGSFPASWGQIHNHVMIKRKLKDVLGFNQFFTIAFSGNLINSSKLIVLCIYLHADLIFHELLGATSDEKASLQASINVSFEI